MSLRVLHVIPCRFWGGPERQTLQVAYALRERYGHESVFCVMPHPETPAEQNPLVLRAREKGFDAVPFVLRNNYNLVEGLAALRAFIHRYQPDVVCAVGYKADLLAAFGANVPTVAVIRGWTRQDWKVGLYEWLDRLTLRRHSGIIIVSETQRSLLRRLGVTDRTIYYAPNAVDPCALPIPSEKISLVNELGVVATGRLVGSVGRLSIEKGQRYLVEAFALLQPEFSGDRLLLLGDGAELSSLRKLTIELNLWGKVILAGFRQDAQRIIGSLDLFVLPSLTEGMPNVILEAFAYKTPVVATAVGGVPELVKDGETGWLVPPRDPHALAQAIREALSNPEEARRRAENAYRHLLANFTVEKQAEAWERALQAAVENWKRRRR